MAKRGGIRKVTKEIADFIINKHEEGYVHKEIKKLIKEKYAVDLHQVTITRYYKSWGDVIKEYKRMAGKQKRDRYDRIYHRHYRRLDKYLSELFSEKATLSIEEIVTRLRERTEIEFRPKTLKKRIELYTENGNIVLSELDQEAHKKT
jgi:hypothetical protein